jgi:hypothetical protein
MLTAPLLTVLPLWRFCCLLTHVMPWRADCLQAAYLVLVVAAGVRHLGSIHALSASQNRPWRR